MLAPGSSPGADPVLGAPRGRPAESKERLWRSLRTTPWFACLDPDGIIEEWLAGSADEQVRAVESMGSAAKANLLVSEHLLVQDGKEIAFFHEAFFDYSFARGTHSEG
ncbi:hypothetical protein [Streptomyces hawaiiensis]|uniref:hypothetical protein n=1 Tax=Streptomyces hawaiiensis TaxID=67305 RepID=UPI00364DF7DE